MLSKTVAVLVLSSLLPSGIVPSSSARRGTFAGVRGWMGLHWKMGIVAVDKALKARKIKYEKDWRQAYTRRGCIWTDEYRFRRGGWEVRLTLRQLRLTIIARSRTVVGDRDVRKLLTRLVARYGKPLRSTAPKHIRRWGSVAEWSNAQTTLTLSIVRRKKGILVWQTWAKR